MYICQKVRIFRFEPQLSYVHPMPFVSDPHLSWLSDNICSLSASRLLSDSFQPSSTTPTSCCHPTTPVLRWPLPILSDHVRPLLLLYLLSEHTVRKFLASFGSNPFTDRRAKLSVQIRLPTTSLPSVNFRSPTFSTSQDYLFVWFTAYCTYRPFQRIQYRHVCHARSSLQPGWMSERPRHELLQGHSDRF